MSKRPRFGFDSAVVVSDLHVGCQVGLCPYYGARMDEGGAYKPNAVQRKMWLWWQDFWRNYVPRFTDGQPYAVVINGDILDGVHHGSTTQWSHNLSDQRATAQKILEPIVHTLRTLWGSEQVPLYIIRGTEAHAGKSAEYEEELARNLGALPDEVGRFARNDLWLRVGKFLGHIMHHIGTAGSQAYESSAVMRELTEEFTEAARWGERSPDFIVRSHRHRCLGIDIPTRRCNGFAITTPAWQAKTPFAYRVAGARNARPQFGGLVVKAGDGPYYRYQTWNIGRSREEA